MEEVVIMDATHAVSVIDHVIGEYGSVMGQTGEGMILRNDLTVVRDWIAEFRARGLDVKSNGGGA